MTDWTKSIKNVSMESKNIKSMFRSTAIIMIISELTGVVAVLIDGIVTSRFLGVDIYSGISLLRPFTSIVLLMAGFVSTGCNIVCSNLIGLGEKDEANKAFNLSVFLGAALSLLLIAACLLFPDAMLTLCGISLTKYPELNPHMYSYLNGFLLGVPVMILIQVLGPILVMDNGKRGFTISSILLCLVDIAGDLLNVFVFHGGAFGMGLATSIAYLVQFVIIFLHFTDKEGYFRLMRKYFALGQLKDIVKYGTPALVKKASGTLRDSLVNYINIMVALSAAAIAARGIQSDLFLFLFCIPTGLGRTLITMVGIYYSANDLKGLSGLVSYATRFGLLLSGTASVLTFLAAPILTGIYTSDPEVAALAVFSIRWMSVALVFDTSIVLIQHYLQGTENLRQANLLSFAERFAVPVITALVLGLAFGSKGILASVAVGKIILLLSIILLNIIHCKGIPKHWTQYLFLPEDFGGSETDNMYEEILTMDDVIETSKKTQDFCLNHGLDGRKAMLMALFVEEMVVNVISNAQEKGIDDVRVDFRLFINEEKAYFSIMDLSEQFDPTDFYELHKYDSPEEHLGIRMVTKLAKKVQYYSTYKSNNLIVYLE